MVSKNYEISLDLFEKNIHSATEWLGENHPVTIDFLQRLAFLYEDMGRLDDWLKTHQDVVNRIGTTYGENSRNHLDEKLNLVRQLRSYEDQLDAAENLAKEVRAAWVEKLGGENFKEVAIVDLNLGRVYEHQGKMESAKEYLEKASEVLPDDFKELRIAKLNLYMGLKDFAKARPIRAYEVDLQNKQYGEQSMTAANNHQYVSYLDEQLARIAKENGEMEAAQSHLESSEQRLKTSLAILNDHKPRGAAQIQEIHNVQIKLGFCLTNQGKSEEAIETLLPALEFDDWNDKSKWKHARAQGVLGEALTELGKYEKAEEALVKAQAGFDEFLNKKSDRVSYNKKMATRFIKLYKDMKRPELVAIWEDKLDQQKAQEAELLSK
jgi:tetratricopeptide (TPR) repeat protein